MGPGEFVPQLHESSLYYILLFKRSNWFRFAYSLVGNGRRKYGSGPKMHRLSTLSVYQWYMFSMYIRV